MVRFVTDTTITEIKNVRVVKTFIIDQLKRWAGEFFSSSKTVKIIFSSKLNRTILESQSHCSQFSVRLRSHIHVTASKDVANPMESCVEWTKIQGTIAKGVGSWCVLRTQHQETGDDNVYHNDYRNPPILPLRDFR